MKVKGLNRSSWASVWFDILRWGAAFYVVVFHLRPMLFRGDRQIQHPGVVVTLFYGLTSIGYEFVMLFFVLSGFLIGSSVMRNVLEGRWSWKSYLVQRLTRLWIVLIPALIITWIWARTETAVFHNGSYFASSIHWSVFMGNILFLQGITVTNFGQNLPLWSLTYEFWYYIMFPCLIWIFAARRWVTKLVYAIVLMALLSVAGVSIDLYFTVWLLGAALAVAPIPRSQVVQRWTGVWLSFVMILVLPVVLILGKVYIVKFQVPNFDMVGSFPADYAVSVIFASALYLVLYRYNDSPANPMILSTSGKLAGFSYTLYLTHYPVLNFLRKWLGNGTWGVWVPSPSTVSLALMILLVILAYAWFISRLTEARTAQARKAVLSLLDIGYRFLRTRGETRSSDS